MNNKILKSFANEIEKSAVVGSLLMGGLHLMSLKDQIAEMQQRTQINPLQKDMAKGLKLRSPYSYQFEGGKDTGLKETITPHTF